jgi:hypothetical protein
MRKLLFGLSLFFLLFLASAENSYACVCVPQDKNASLNQQVRDAYKNSAAVFAGKVVGIDGNSHPTLIFVTIQVFDAWKGNIPQTIVIVTNKGQTACEFPFQLNSEYLIYGINDGGNISTNICLRTNFLANNPDVAILNKMTKRN